jgi:hypothetical protein
MGPGSGAIEVDTVFESTVFGVPSTIKVFNQWFGAVDSSFVFTKDYFASGFGLIQRNVYEADFNTTFVIGAIIDGVRYGTLTSVSADVNNYPEDYELMQNYPNPFNPSTTIEYELPHQSVVELRVHNLVGEEVATLEQSVQSVGRHKLVWDGRDRNGNRVSTGVYFYSLDTNRRKITRKLVILR